MSNKINSVEERRAISEVKLAMVKAAKLNIKACFPAFGDHTKKVGTSRKASHTKKGAGRFHQQGKKKVV